MRNLALLAVLLSAAAAHAAPLEILVDFGAGGIAPTLGGTWNTLNSANMTLWTVNDSAGTLVPGASILSIGWTDTDVMGNTMYAWQKEWVDARILTDFTFVRLGTSSAVFIRGLPPGQLYDVEVAASSEPLAGSWVADYTLNMGLATVPPSDVSSFGYDPETNGQGFHQIMRWQGVPLDGNGELVLRAQATPPDYQALLNGMRITPEPTSAAMLLLGLAASLIRRRRP